MQTFKDFYVRPIVLNGISFRIQQRMSPKNSHPGATWKHEHTLLSQILDPSKSVLSTHTDHGCSGPQTEVFHISYYEILFTGYSKNWIWIFCMSSRYSVTEPQHLNNQSTGLDSDLYWSTLFPVGILLHVYVNKLSCLVSLATTPNASKMLLTVRGEPQVCSRSKELSKITILFVSRDDWQDPPQDLMQKRR